MAQSLAGEADRAGRHWRGRPREVAGGRHHAWELGAGTLILGQLCVLGGGARKAPEARLASPALAGTLCGVSIGSFHAAVPAATPRVSTRATASKRVCESGSTFAEQAGAGRRERRPLSRKAKTSALQNLGMFALEAERRKMTKSEKISALCLGHP